MSKKGAIALIASIWIFVVVIFALIAFGCSSSKDAYVDSSRFDVETMNYGSASAITDTETGVQYLCVITQRGSVALTPLLDEEGKPYHK